MTELHLSLPAARSLHLAAQGLLVPRRKKAVKNDVLDAIRHMSVLQIDTINVVARSPYLVLWSRLGDYPLVWLEELLAEGKLFEYWAHEASFLPIEDYGLYRHRMQDPAAMGWKYSVQWMAERKEEVERLVEHIRANGPVKSSDFERKDGKGGGWWEWKEEKRSLEVLFTAGRLMIARRQSFQRLYDLRERVLPGWDDSMTPHLDEVHRRFMLKAVFSLGVAKASWMGDYFRNSRLTPRPDPETLADRGELLRVSVAGWDVPGYIHPELLPLAVAAADGQLKPGVTTLLSPFDPVVWDRRRAQEFFGFDYRLECYTPEAKRRYGYFTLPILRRGALVGRIDAKAHRARGVFEVKVLHLEDGVRLTPALAADIAGALQRCGAWHGTPEIAVTRCEPAAFMPLLQKALAG